MLDVSLSASRSPRCDGRTRRDFLRVGAVAGLSLPLLLRAEAGAASPGAGARAKSVILVFLGGGISHLDTFDMKPEAPEEVCGKYKPIASAVPSLSVCEKLPMLAGVMDKVTLVRSAAHTNDHHETATNWVLSGRFGTPFGDYPAIGAVTAHQLGFAGDLPPYVAVPQNPSFTWELGKSAFLGGRYESFKAGDPNDTNYKVPDVTPTVPRSPKSAARRESLLKAIDGLAAKVEGNDQIATYDEFHQRAATILLSPAAKRAFDVAAEPVAVRDRYGRTTAGQSMLMARRLVESGVRFVTVNYGGWDHHGKIFDRLDQKLPEFDRAVSALVGDMHDRGTHEDTLVVVMGEFGRTPKINKDAGRDHWGPAGSMLVFGAGTKQGFVMGKTDKHGAYATQRPVAPADVAFTILAALGIDPHDHITTPDGRPLEILDGGEFVQEWFA